METDPRIIRLDPANFKKCGSIWDMERQSGLAERFYRELLCGNRITYVFRVRQAAHKGEGEINGKDWI